MVNEISSCKNVSLVFDSNIYTPGEESSPEPKLATFVMLEALVYFDYRPCYWLRNDHTPQFFVNDSSL